MLLQKRLFRSIVKLSGTDRQHFTLNRGWERMRKKYLIFSFLFTFLFILLSVNLYHYDYNEQGYNFGNDEWGIQAITKKNTDQGFFELLNVRQMVYPYNEELKNEQVSTYPKGFECLFGTLFLVTGLSLKQSLFGLSIVFISVTSSVSSIISWKMFRRLDVMSLTAFLATLVPSRGFAHGPLFILPSTIVFIFLLMLILCILTINNNYLLLTFILSMTIVLTHRASTAVLLIFLAVLLSNEKFRKSAYVGFSGFYIGIIINKFVAGNVENESLFSLPNIIDLRILLVALPLISILFYIFIKKWNVFNGPDYKMKNLSHRLLLFYFSPLCAFFIYFLYSASISKTTSMGYYFWETIPGYFVFTSLIVSGFAVPTIAYFMFSKKPQISLLNLFALILIIASFLYLENPTENTRGTIGRLPVYAAGFLTFFIAKFIVIHIGSNKNTNIIVAIFLTAMIGFNLEPIISPINSEPRTIVGTDSDEIAPYISSISYNNTIITGGIILTRLAPTLGFETYSYYQTETTNMSLDSNNSFLGYNWHMRNNFGDIIILPKYQLLEANIVSYDDSIEINEENLLPHKSLTNWRDLTSHYYLKVFENSNIILYVKN